VVTFLRSVQIRWDSVEDRERHPFDVGALQAFGTLDVSAPVTIFVGGNGSGKSTLLEGLAVHQGMNPEGGTSNMVFSTRAQSVSPLHEHLWVDRGGMPRTKFFLRAESFFNVASAIDEYEVERFYGGSLHERSHGESFLDLVENRFTDRGLYLLDEPEAALSVHGQLRLLVNMYDLVTAGSQFILATHSPMLMAYPGAVLYEFDATGIERVEWDDVDTVMITRSFLEDPGHFLARLFDDELVE
jgi:predicted ATPase